MLVLFIYITRLVSKEIFSPSNKILMATIILMPALLYLIPTVTNNKEISVFTTVIENEMALDGLHVVASSWL